MVQGVDNNFICNSCSVIVDLGPLREHVILALILISIILALLDKSWSRVKHV